MNKHERIREEDYWVFPVMLVTVVLGVTALYASVPMFRIPAIILFSMFLWFTSFKIRRSYSPARSRIHVTSTVLVVLILTWLLHVVTN